MEILRVPAGLVAMHAERLIMVCAVKPTGKVAVRDLASGELSEIAVGELSARPITTRENDLTRLACGCGPSEPTAVSHGRASRKLVSALVRGRAPS